MLNKGSPQTPGFTFTIPPAVISLAKALSVTTDELLGLKPPKVALVEEDSETRRDRKRFQMIATLPEHDQKAVVRLIDSLVAASSLRRNGSAPGGERNGC